MNGKLISENKHFTLQIKQGAEDTYIKMQMLSHVFMTSDLPQTYPLLTSYLPSIISCECFNDEAFPFMQEVQHTQIGHLFEHILLEYIYQLNVSLRKKQVSVSGDTQWNWQKDPPGVFHISIDQGVKEKEILYLALEKSIALLTTILETTPIN